MKTLNISAVRMPAESYPFHPSPNGLTSSEGMSLKEFLARPVYLASRDLSNTASLNVFSTWLANSAVADKLRNFKLVRGRPKMVIVTQGLSFQAGRIVLSYDMTGGNAAGVDSQTASRIYNIVQAVQAPHAILDISASSVYELSLPWPSVTGWHGLRNERDGLVEFFQESTTLSEPRRFNTGGPPEFTYDIYFALEEAEVSIPVKDDNLGNAMASSALVNQNVSFARTNGRGAVTFQSAAKAERGKVSGPLTSIAEATDSLGKIPGLGQYMTPAGMALRMGANLAKQAGYCVAEDQNYTPSMLNKYASSFSFIDGNQNVQKLTNHPMQSCPITSTSAGIGSDNDMDLVSITEKWGLVARMNWQDSVVRDPNWFNDPEPRVSVTPCFYAEKPNGFSEAMVLTPLAFAALPFMYWSGSLTYKVEIVASSFSRGVLGIGVNYDVENIAQGTREDVNVMPTYFIDLADDSRSVEFTVPWACGRQFLNTWPTGSLDPDVSCLNAHLDFFSVLKVINPTEAGSTPTDLDILVWVKAGPDFVLQRPTLSTINNTLRLRRGTVTLQSTTGETLDTVDADETEVVLETVENPAPVTRSLLCFGEDFHSIKQLMVKYCNEMLILPRDFTYNPPTTSNLWIGFTMPVVTWTPYNFGLVDRWQYYPSGDQPIKYHYMTYRTWFQSAFLGYRGGLNYKIASTQSYVPNNPSPSSGQHAEVSLVHFTDTTDTSLPYQYVAAGDAVTIGTPTPGLNVLENLIDLDTESESLAVFHNFHNMFHEWSTPWVEPTNYVPIRQCLAEFLSGATSSYGMADKYMYYKQSMPYIEALSQSYKLYSAAADDFALYQFMYVPIFTGTAFSNENGVIFPPQAPPWLW